MLTNQAGGRRARARRARISIGMAPEVGPERLDIDGVPAGRCCVKKRSDGLTKHGRGEVCVSKPPDQVPLAHVHRKLPPPHPRPGACDRSLCAAASTQWRDVPE
jgi:hypothetical protein